MHTDSGTPAEGATDKGTPEAGRETMGTCLRCNRTGSGTRPVSTERLNARWADEVDTGGTRVDGSSGIVGPYGDGPVCARLKHVIAHDGAGHGSEHYDVQLYVDADAPIAENPAEAPGTSPDVAPLRIRLKKLIAA